MKYYIRQAVFSFGDKFQIYDAAGNVMFTAEGEVFTWVKKLHLFHTDGTEAAYIEKEFMTLSPRFAVTTDCAGEQTVSKEILTLTPEYTVDPIGWNVTGDFFVHDYSICHNGDTVAQISKEWFTFGDAYEIDVCGTDLDALVLAVVLVIDAVLARQ